MNLEPLHVPDLLRRYDIRPRKSLGQNFLADHNALLKIVRDAEIGPEDEVLEIGAGLGSLTRLLALNARSVTAIEIDRELFPVLQAVTEPFENVRLVAGDVLKIPVETLFSANGYKVVANIPYYITSAVIRHLLEAKVRPERVALTMQREVAERILSSDEKMSLLSLSVQIYGQARIASQIPAACFIPEPKVDSSVLVVDIYPEPKLSSEEVDLLFSLAHAAFNQKRKMLRNSLQPVLGGDSEVVSAKLQEVGINPQARPENLALDEWIKLVDTCKD
ncbi:MAG: ribosomal RNA small subunit methyltransferase A [Anaerolineaceae bacterium]|nr:ribosomal RNA small subunit methyltransferase A [Anaerolineaceae bacterium]